MAWSYGRGVGSGVGSGVGLGGRGVGDGVGLEPLTFFQDLNANLPARVCVGTRALSARGALPFQDSFPTVLY